MVISDKQKKKKKHPLTVHGRTGLLSTSGHPGEGVGQSRSSRRAFVNTEGRVLERIPRMERVEVNEEGGNKPVGWMEPTGSFLTGGYTPTIGLPLPD